ncbi:hypothetical protein BC629DRAFT_681619 [Irpex lacteus]|nr:hypothetical protein BC629DRAFT_681619 [Irpex lacteus]
MSPAKEGCVQLRVVCGYAGSRYVSPIAMPYSETIICGNESSESLKAVFLRAYCAQRVAVVASRKG